MDKSAYHKLWYGDGKLTAPFPDIPMLVHHFLRNIPRQDQ
jgi:hypothetical protein